MSFPFYFGSRLTFNGGIRRSGLMVKIAIAAMALSVAVILLSIAVLNGFQQEIRNKLAGLTAHIQLTRYDMNTSYENRPVIADKKVLDTLRKVPGVSGVNWYITRPGIIKTHADLEGVVLKGLDTTYDATFVQNNLLEGRIPDWGSAEKSKDILISKVTAGRLRLQVGDSFYVYFLQEPVRYRKFFVSGIYETGLEEFDKLFALVDLRQLRTLNGWDDNQVGGYEVRIDNFDRLDLIWEDIYSNSPQDMRAEKITDLYPQIFDWLTLLDGNVLLIIVLMLIVGALNMATALLVMILEKNRHIALLQTMGADNRQVSRVFLWQAFWLIFFGVVLGNVLGLGIGLAQQEWHWIKLDQESYYISSVPVTLNWWVVLLVNAGAILFSLLCMMLPVLAVRKVKPVALLRWR